MVTFSIIAHVDHGKSSLSQRLLEQQGNIEPSSETRQSALDTLEVEKSRGITVKAVTATMLYEDENDEEWLVNLVDTPGHADFAHEVKRSLACCDGALLLVDAAQGVEAQTLSVASAAASAGVPLLAACSKCDLETADPDEVSLNVATAGILEDDDPEAVLRLSAKTGENVDAVLPAVVSAFSGRMDRPSRAEGTSGKKAPLLRARVVDCRYDEKRGVVCVVQVVDGELREQQRIRFLARASAQESGAEEHFGIQELGLLTPEPVRSKFLPSGAVGYMICGLRDVRQAVVGDTIAESSEWKTTTPLDRDLSNVAASAGDQLLFASIFPPDGNLFDDMARAVDRLALNDASVSVAREAPRPELGAGLRLGFLGLLHMDVFRQRLRDEFDADVLFCAPLVPYRLVDKASGQMVREIRNLDEWPDSDELAYGVVYEPIVEIQVVVPVDHLGVALELLQEKCVRQTFMDSAPPKATLRYEAQWSRVVEGLGEQLANTTRGLASLSVDPPRWVKNESLVKVEIALNGQVVDALSIVAPRDDAPRLGRATALKLKEHVPRQQFEVIIQAKLHSKSIARERVAPFRKDVLTKSGKTVGGGDISRKKKLLEKQKEGKARQKTVGNVSLSQDAFWAVLGVASPSNKSST